jgi:hypothetical protein
MSSAAPARSLALPIALVISCAVCGAMLAMGLRQSFGLFLAPMTAEHGWAARDFAFAIGLQVLINGISQPFMGQLADRFGGRRVVMGGAVTGQGNTSVSAEFNIAFDPEAAHVVFEAFPAFDLVDWEAVLRHGLPHVDVEQWLDAPAPKAAFYKAISQRTREWSEGRRGTLWINCTLPIRSGWSLTKRRTFCGE